MWWQCDDNVMTLWWQCDDNVMTLWWQWDDNVMTMWWQCDATVMTMWWHCDDTVMTMWRQCDDNVMTMWWQWDDNVITMWWHYPLVSRCRTCICQQGSVECQSNPCPVAQCSHPSRDQCCEVCAGCLYGGQEWRDGQRFPDPAGGCRTCVCNGGKYCNCIRLAVFAVNS